MKLLPVVAALLFVSLLSAGAAESSASKPQTLVTTSSPVRGFAQDGSRIAWLTGTDRATCTRTLHVRSLALRQTQTALQVGCRRNPASISGLALAGDAAAWDSFVDGDLMRFKAAIETARLPEARAHRVDRISGTRGDGYPESYPAVAGAGSFLAFSTQAGVRRIVGGKARPLFAFSKPLDLAVSGDRVAVVRQELRPGDGCACINAPDWRPDGKIGFLSTLSSPPNGKREITLIDPSGSGRTVITNDDRRRYSLDWSQDGSTVVYSYGAPAGGEAIAIADADGSNAHDVASGGDPSLSPDGSKVAFTYWVGIDFIQVANADGSGERRLAVGTMPAWSPDGERIAFTDVGAVLSVINADGSGLHRLGSLAGGYPEWSPDGARLAYANDGIWIADADGSNPHRLTNGPDFDPHWSPDGRSLVFETARDRLARDPFRAFELYLVAADGSNLRPLTYHVPSRWATVGELRSARGRLIFAFEAPGVTAGVALAGSKTVVGTQDLAGGGRITTFAANGTQLTNAPLPGQLPVIVGANGRWVVFRTGEKTIRAFDLRTSTARTLAVAPVSPIGLSVSGRRVAWGENLVSWARIRALLLPR